MRTVVRNKLSWLVFAALLFYFVVMYLLGPMNSYATGKIARLVVRGTTFLLIFQIYVQSKNLNNNNFAILFGLLSIFYISQAYVLYNIRPSGLFDVSFFRDMAEMIGREAEAMIVSSHTLGYLSIGAFVFMVSEKKFEIGSLWILFLILILLLIVIISGARQTIIAFAGIISFRIILSEGSVIKNGLIALVCLIVMGTVVFNIGLSSIEKSKAGSTANEMLNRDLDTPFKIMAINPISGVGFGGYPEYANKTYPHNMILEIFAELGLIGSVIIAGFIVVSTVVQNVYIRYTTKNNSYFILFLIIYIFRAMISGDLSSSIIIFAILLSFINLSRYN